MNVMSENAGPVALLEATAEARTLIEELTRLAEELKGREERRGELLSPSEAALRARTEYVDTVIRDEPAGAEQGVLKLAEEVAGIARRLKAGLRADVDSPGRDGSAAPQREGGSRTLVDDRLPSGDAGRGLSGGTSRQ